MIIDDIKYAEHYYEMHSEFKTAFEYLKELDYENCECGRYEIKEDNVFAVIQEYETKDPEKAEFEAHGNYIDIQFILEGEERLDYTSIEDFEQTTKYDSEKDIMFGNCTRYNSVIAKQGDFIIFLPSDAHKPSLTPIKTPNKVKKVVVKVKARI